MLLKSSLSRNQPPVVAKQQPKHITEHIKHLYESRISMLGHLRPSLNIELNACMSNKETQINKKSSMLTGSRSPQNISIRKDLQLRKDVYTTNPFSTAVTSIKKYDTLQPFRSSMNTLKSIPIHDENLWSPLPLRAKLPLHSRSEIAVQPESFISKSVVKLYSNSHIQPSCIDTDFPSFSQAQIESDYLDNIRSPCSIQHKHNQSLSVNRRQQTINFQKQTNRKPVVKVDMDLESNELHLIQSALIPMKRRKNKTIDRSILRRSLSQSARSLVSKANQLKEDQSEITPQPAKCKRKVTSAWKILMRLLSQFNNYFIENAGKQEKYSLLEFNFKDDSRSQGRQNQSSILDARTGNFSGGGFMDMSNQNYNNNNSTDLMMAKPLLGKVNKLSNKGWNFHFRLLKMDGQALSYFKSVPKDFNEQKLTSVMAEEKQLKPKQSIPIKRIASVNEVQEDDKKKFKKLAKAHSIAFKVAFHKKYMVKGKEYNAMEDNEGHEEDEDEDEEEEEEEAKGGKSKGAKGKKQQSLTTWYFVCENKVQWEEWIRRLLILGKQQNPSFMADEKLMDKFRGSLVQASKISLMGTPNRNDLDDDDEEEQLPQKQVAGKGILQKQQPQPNKAQQQIQQTSLNDKQPSSKQDQLSKQTQQIKGQQSQQLNKPNTSSKLDFDLGRTDSEFQDLNQILQQNLNINNVNLDGDGNVNDQNQTKENKNDDDEEDKNYDNDPDARDKLFKLKESVSKYFKQSHDLQGKKMRKEQKGWDLKFQNYWGYLVQADKNLQDSMTLSERFFDHVGKFRRTAEQLVKEIIDDLHLPPGSQQARSKHIPVLKIQEEHMVFLDDEDAAVNNAASLFYFEKNICIKIIHQGEQMVAENANNNTQQQQPNRTSNNALNSMMDNSYLGNSQSQSKNADPFQNLKWKQYGREFLSMDVMFDSLFLLSKPESSYQYKLRVPLSALVDYKGFRALAVASIPIQPGLGPSIGFYTDGKYVPHDQKLKQELVYVGDVLNLKENRISQKSTNYNQQNIRQFETVPVSFFIKVYNYQQPESKNKGKDPDTPTKKSQDYHFSELQYQEEPFYVLKTSEIFPYDVDLNEVYPRKDKYLRPEFVCIYERPLKADARKDLGPHIAKDTKSKDDDNDQVELNEASRYLKNTIIPQLVNLLDSLIIMPVDSESLTTTFHSQGVNMRYLGLVCGLSIVPHVRDICITEMIARTLKNILNKQIASMVLDHQNRYQEFLIALENYKKQQKIFQSSSQTNALGKRGASSNITLQQQQDLEKMKQQIDSEDAELKRNLDDTIKMSIVDYINLVFGAGDETREFWQRVLVPYTAQYFSFSQDEIMKHSINLNAIFFGFLYHSGIKILRQSFLGGKKEFSDSRLDNGGRSDKYGGVNVQVQKEDDFFKEFGKTEMPFGQPDKSYLRIEIVPKSKTYGLRNLPYRILANKYQDFKQDGLIENSLKCCQMRRLMKRALEDKEEISTLADICEISLDHMQFRIAVEKAIEALKHVHPLHAEAIKFYCILMRAHFVMEDQKQADQFFSRALTTLDHHWGPYHPLHSTIYGIMAYLLILKNKMEEAKYLYQSSLLCCLRVLGPNHIQTAEVHMDFGRLYLKMKNKDEALQHFEEAYLIFESFFGLQSLSTAQAAQQIANILEEQGKLNDAFKYSDIAYETFNQTHIYGDTNEKSISALWLKLSISYSLKRNDMIPQCRKLYEAILKRDYQLNNHTMIMEQQNQKQLNQQQSMHDQNSELINSKIQQIKEYCIAATILEMTRALPREERLTLKSFCDKVLFRAHQQNEEGLPNLADLQQKIDPVKLMSISNLKFDDFGRQFLEYLYQLSKDQEGGFVTYYQKTLDAAMNQMNEAKKQTSLQASSQVKPSRGEQNVISEFFLQSEGPEDFFKRTIKTFENYNFYNVLLL